MIPVIHKMRDASKGRVVRLVKYVSSDNGKPDRIGEIFITNCGAAEPYIASREMEATQALNTRSADDKTVHLSVSFPTGEKPSSEHLKQIEERIAKALGYEEYQRISVVHNDTDNVHMHMVINKIHPTKNTIRTVWNDHGIVAKVCAELESELSLRTDNHKTEKSHREANIESLEHKHGTESFASYARDFALSALETSKTWADFHEQLADAGITARLRGNGLVFADYSGEYAAKGSSLGRKFSKANLERALGAYEAPEEKIQLLNFQTAYEEKAVYGEKSLYEEYKALQDKAAGERTERLAALKEERDRAVAGARDEATKEIKSQTLANIFRTHRLKQILIRQTENKLTGKIREAFEAKRDEIRQMARQSFADWLREKADAGDERALLSLAQKEKGKKAKEGGQDAGKPEASAEKVQIRTILKADEKADTAKQAERHPPKSNYDEYKEFREREAAARAAERAAMLEALRKEQGEAIAAAKIKARQIVEAQPAEIFRSKRLTNILRRRDERKAVTEIQSQYRAKRDEVYKATRTTGYVDWLKREAAGGNVRAISALRAKGEVAPGLITISSRQMQYAKIVAEKIAGVTGRGTLFYKAGEDVYRDDGKNISVKEGITDTGIKNALIIAGAKFNAPLTLGGTDDFKRRCVEVASRERLQLTFDDPTLETVRQKSVKEVAHENKEKFIEGANKVDRQESRGARRKGFSR